MLPRVPIVSLTIITRRTRQSAMLEDKKCPQTRQDNISKGQTDFQSRIPPSRSIPQARLEASSSSSSTSFSPKTITQSYATSLKELASSHRRRASSASLAIHIYTSPSASYILHILHTFTHLHIIFTRRYALIIRHRNTKPERSPSPLTIYPITLPNEAGLEKCNSGWTRS
ncbi:hypothetical protein CNYM01_12656 [Colletotrichum nymphaeae SA-01]|uniref:Uncharacterized protein n=1 Tax=Colletotrichum nymphaeae SA-01 TaxID=1460502 RepID=A0A135SUS0_9PEZI|nr:hypothetical protein CNYM01_12656 [Colletotrichum nymphaeae SA-01]